MQTNVKEIATKCLVFLISFLLCFWYAVTPVQAKSQKRVKAKYCQTHTKKKSKKVKLSKKKVKVKKIKSTKANKAKKTSAVSEKKIIALSQSYITITLPQEEEFYAIICDDGVYRVASGGSNISIPEQLQDQYTIEPWDFGC